MALLRFLGDGIVHFLLTDPSRWLQAAGYVFDPAVPWLGNQLQQDAIWRFVNLKFSTRQPLVRIADAAGQNDLALAGKPGCFNRQSHGNLHK